MSDPSCSIAICDANILIDFISVDEDVLREMASYWKEVYVPDCVIAEVEQITTERAQELNLKIVSTPYKELKTIPGLSFEDTTCLYYVEIYEALCITNDVRLRKACRDIGRETVWGLEMLLRLAKSQRITKARAKDDATRIQKINPQIDMDILNDFLAKLAKIK